MRPPVLRGVKARQGGQLPITKRSAGDGAVAQVQCFDLGRCENMHLAGPDIAPVRAVRPHGIMVARGDKDLRWAFGQGLAQLIDGIAIDCAGIEEVPGQQHQAAARVPPGRSWAAAGGTWGCVPQTAVTRPASMWPMASFSEVASAWSSTKISFGSMRFKMRSTCRKGFSGV